MIERGPLSAEDWRAIEPLLDAVLDAPTDRRAAVIVQLCAGDPVKIAALERLVSECSQDNALLDGNAVDLLPSLVQEEAGAPHVPPVLAERYRVGREIGHGGMAFVFLAHDLTHDRPVAVKVMRPSVRTQFGANRFLTEIRLTARLRHPHIVPLYDSGETEDALFFVMPYFEGESLAARIDREGALAPTEALKIAADIAAALEYAHDQGLIHRDIKPSNILFSSGQAVLADFGIARIASERGSTGSGMVIGTPEYMSPEQAAGDRGVDARSDIYSLGAVLFEMLTGGAPPTAITRVALKRHGIDEVAELGETRPSIPLRLSALVTRAIALNPADRFDSAAGMATALHECARSSTDVAADTRATRWRRLPLLATAAAAVLMLLGVGVLVYRGGPAATSPSSPLAAVADAAGVDSSRYVVLPYVYGADVAERLDDPDRMSESMRSWAGVSVVDRAKVADTIAAHPTRLQNPSGNRATALALGAGRYVRRELTRRSGVLVVHAAVIDTRSGENTGDGSIALPANEHDVDSAFAALSAQLLFPGVPADRLAAGAVGSRSRPALLSFLAGRRAVDEWELARADSAFVAAAAFDNDYAQAHLWTAQVRVWRDMPAPAWRFEAARASTGLARLSARDRRAIEALTIYAAGDSSRACGLWAKEARVAADFAALYGAAMCQLRDRAVVRDHASPTGWRFRSSYHAATVSLRRAFQILPATYRNFRESYWRLGTLLRTQPTQLRNGHAVRPDTGSFYAYLSLSSTGDTVEFLPYPAADFSSGKGAIPASRAEAVRRQRALFRDIATTWRAAFPASADAMLALAIARDEQGDHTAIDSLSAARQLATDDDQRFRTAATEVWMRIKLAVPGDLVSLHVARALADSLVRTYPNPPASEASALASLAMVSGHVGRAAALARLQPAEDGFGPISVPATVPALLAFSAAGGPPDSLRALEAEVASVIRAAAGPGAEDWMQGMRLRWLVRSLTLAFPTYQTPSLGELAQTRDILATTESAWAARDTAQVLRRLDGLRRARRFAAPEDAKLESTYPEAWLLDALGDSSAALDWIAPRLDAESRTSTSVLSEVGGMGALIRAMAFRADLARRMGDAVTAKRWALAVTTLWEDADPYLQRSVVEKMRRITR